MTICEAEYRDVETPSGPMRCHLFRPNAEGAFPGLVLYSEIYQMTGPIARIANFLAGHGYVVCVPEIYHEYEEPGVAYHYDKEGTDRGNELKTTKSIAAYDADASAAISVLESLSSCSGKVGTIGFCIGGHLAFRAAMDPRVRAAACFYPTDIHKRSLGAGMNDDSLDRIPEISGELLMIFGRQDPHVPLEGRRLIKEALEAAERDFQWHEFNGAHAFVRDEGHRYDPVLAGQGFSLSLEMFARKLR
ncbi:dienelactone hydrolase family protein [Pelagicoccus sp. SDUM812005]|uniref:dienelactone hydrolase family protein n=1 Tax=Pelagicoccus sp. SDUM812005 TaxID=3041257 RepID=UPI00280EC0C4|nr:dienelactone hydrolase family protein [Pelagicoccus sp. SDUM812005]MDQ8179178.1 dienelactone hydrolase family protein [Pelagicoccus sp. SDUM812005]